MLETFIYDTSNFSDSLVQMQSNIARGPAVASHSLNMQGGSGTV